MQKIINVLIILTALLGSSLSLLMESNSGPAASGEFSQFELLKFENHSVSRLPIYEKYFKLYSREYNIPWTLLAAVAYQESKWDNKAISHTGVRGLMQITAKTAEHIGIEDRDNPLESIRGGAFYLQYLYQKTPTHLLPSQRWALALAGYNIGWGHIRDAYRLAHKLKMNANNWEDLKTVLPLLEDKDYYPELIYGYARGNETVDFVENVFNYFYFLNKKFNLQASVAQY